MKYVLDTSVIVDRTILRLLDEKRLEEPIEILIPTVVASEIEYQANKGKKIGNEGMKVLIELRSRVDRVEYVGERPTLEQIKLSPSGELDYLIREVARAKDAVLITADRVQAAMAKAEGIETFFVRKDEFFEPKYHLENFFDHHTMSVHLKENLKPMAKKGTPGHWKLVALSEDVVFPKDLYDFANHLIIEAKRGTSGFLEIDEQHAKVIQKDDYRIVITFPPFSDNLEITIVKPITKLSLKDYKLSRRLLARLEAEAEGILICGPPGSGKSTFAAALAEFYASKGKIVKTLERPRDLQVSEMITQYTALEGDFEKTSDLLYLVRPDYTIFDEVRKTRDFEIYADLRLAGVGLVGVVHSKSSIDAIQRMIGRVELGLIPQIIDTVIFISEGKIEEKNVNLLNLVVKVPSGMFETDLARPVVEIRNLDGNLEYEMYSFGEQIIVAPIGKKKTSRKEKLILTELEKELARLLPTGTFEVSSTVKPNHYVVNADALDIPLLLGKKGKTIERLENMFGVSIDVREQTETPKKARKKKKKRRKK
ncbi:MAG: ATPase, T2SS/T4P/T4SS family [Candidatus Helarchaeales archaeon]